MDLKLKKYYEKIFINKIDNSEKLFNDPSKDFITIVNKLKNNSIAVDLGYGAGVYTNYLLKKGLKVIAVDMVNGQLMVEKNYNYLKQNKLEIIETDINNFKVYLNIDFLISRNTLHYLNKKTIKNQLMHYINLTNLNGYHYLVIFTDIIRKDSLGTVQKIKNEANLSTEELLSLINDLYKDWEVNIFQKYYEEESISGYKYFTANQITIIAKNKGRKLC